eukprot:6383_1
MPVDSDIEHAKFLESLKFEIPKSTVLNDSIYDRRTYDADDPTDTEQVTKDPDEIIKILLNSQKALNYPHDDDHSARFSSPAAKRWGNNNMNPDLSMNSDGSILGSDAVTEDYEISLAKATRQLNPHDLSSQA